MKRENQRPPEVLNVEGTCVARHQLLQLGSGEERQPIRLDDGLEAADGGGALLADLPEHAEVRHQVHVADPASTNAYTVSK